MLQIKLYKGVLPNYKDNTHYFYNDTQQYFKALEGSLIKTITADNYRINNNVLKLTLSSLANYNELTYLIEIVDAKNIRCYYIKNYYVQSGNIYFELQMDLWGSYIFNAQFSKILVTRCNRRIGEGFLDKPKIEGVVDGLKAYRIQSLEESYIPLADLSVVVVLNKIIYQDTSKDENVSEKVLCAVNAKAFYDEFVSHTEWRGMSILEVISRYLGGVYATPATGATTELKATIDTAFLVPTSYIELSGLTIQFKVKTNFIPNTELITTTFTGRSVAYGNNAYGLGVGGGYNSIKYVGAPFNGIELNTSASNLKDGALQSNVVVFQCEADGEGLHLYVRSGNQSKDITSSFVLPILNASKLNTKQEETNFWLKEISSAIKGISGIAGSIMKKDYLGAGTQAITGTLNSIVDHNQAQDPMRSQSTAGGALITYNVYGSWGLHDWLDFPFVITEYPCPYDSKKVANLTGANYMQYVETFNFNNIHFLFSSRIDNNHCKETDDATFIQCSCAINGIPLDAQNTIKAELQAGLYYKYLE